MGLGGAVLAGGASRRMGRDKAFIRVGGRTLLEGAVAALVAAGADPVIVVGGDTAAVADLGLVPVADRHPGQGPLGGVITALDALDTDVVAVLSCDLTDASSPAVRSVVGALGTSDVAVPVVDGVEQWLHAAWRRSARDHLATAFAAGARSVRDGARGLTVTRLLDGDPCWFHDADEPADLPPDAS